MEVNLSVGVATAPMGNTASGGVEVGAVAHSLRVTMPVSEEEHVTGMAWVRPENSLFSRQTRLKSREINKPHYCFSKRDRLSSTWGAAVPQGFVRGRVRRQGFGEFTKNEISCRKVTSQAE